MVKVKEKKVWGGGYKLQSEDITTPRLSSLSVLYLAGERTGRVRLGGGTHICSTQVNCISSFLHHADINYSLMTFSRAEFSDQFLALQTSK